MQQIFFIIVLLIAFFFIGNLFPRFGGTGGGNNGDAGKISPIPSPANPNGPVEQKPITKSPEQTEKIDSKGQMFFYNNQEYDVDGIISLICEMNPKPRIIINIDRTSTANSIDQLKGKLIANKIPHELSQ